MKKTLGGDRLGSGNKMKVDLHGYERSTHDLGHIWRSTMSSGTLVPFLKKLVLPGDTFDIRLDCDIKTHPTVGPLFGSYKVQLDVFQCPIRLYQGQLHNNKLGIGMNMAAVKLPTLSLRATEIDPVTPPNDIDNAQINPSSILAYLGIRGIGTTLPAEPAAVTRSFNGIPFLAYWDIYKNYYANKQEEIGAVIHSPIVAIIGTVDTITFNDETIPPVPPGPASSIPITGPEIINIIFTGATPILNQILFETSQGVLTLEQIIENPFTGAGFIQGTYKYWQYGIINIYGWRYITQTEMGPITPLVATFPLENIDKMREKILADVESINTFVINQQALTPYDWATNFIDDQSPMIKTQEGLAIKTYQSDLFNNWLNTETIDGPNGITEITAIDTSGGSFTLDTLNLSKKVYDMLNRIAVSGGSYDDWQDAIWAYERYTRAETPMYMGGLIKELVFQEVVSNSESTGQTGPVQPLGTLAGKGVLAKKHKGGNITIKIDEPSYIIGLISLTPRIDYSQGNDWDIHLLTMDDFHKPALDEIGFQELITEQMAWWSTAKEVGQPFTQKSAGKQPAWINYMTAVNKCYGNFAIGTNQQIGEMFMTLNRRYEWENGDIKDLTTYIDPVKFNNIFAETSLDAQNFWAQIAIDITARRKISAKQIPNL